MTEREAFEQWAVTEDFSVARDQWERYASIATHHALAGWQASRKQALEEAARSAECYDLGTFEGHEIARCIRSTIPTKGTP